MEGGVHFRVWAPDRRSIAVVIDGKDEPLDPEGNGYHSALLRGVSGGTHYQMRIDGWEKTFPDPASRFQPEGPHGRSMVVDPGTYRWNDAEWKGIGRKGLVLYELHVGTFTREGTYLAALPHLEELAAIGINTIELMPLHESAGTFGWGYDGVTLWAPQHQYGTPDDLRHLVDRAHALGLAVIVDVVYNHLGPSGNYLPQFTPYYFTDRYPNDWGEPLNFDGPQAPGVREYMIENAAHWIDEYHFDGLRLDATQSIPDASDVHVLTEVAAAARAAARGRSVFLVAENEPQDTVLLTEYGLDAMWNDDWHHSAMVAATGNREAYYTDYRGSANEFASMARRGFLYQGQHYSWQKDRRGTPSYGIEPERLVCYLQNHDQVANSADGRRLGQLANPGTLRALTALLLLQPQTPMLFQGQEFGASTPFFYFADHEQPLASMVASGRRGFMSQFPSVVTIAERIPDPADRRTFERSILDHDERQRNQPTIALHRDLLALRRKEPFASQRADWLETAPLGSDCLLLRWMTEPEEQRLLVVNLGSDLPLDIAHEPLLAPPPGFLRWAIEWSSESPDYGGSGTREPDTDEGWRIKGHAAILLRPAR